MSKKFYITTTLPYINSDPHIGFAMEIIEADVLARFRRLQGDEVFFNTGTDEHGLKIFEKSKKTGIEPQEYVEKTAEKFRNLKEVLNLSFDNFIRTTDEKHIKAAQEFWKICDQNGYIYKKNYEVKYCVGCEMEKTDSEIENDCCPLHPGQKLEIIKEKNYFFRYSAFQEKLSELYKNNPNLVMPAKRFNEVKVFVKNGLNDFSISRIKEKMPWGIPVPGDDKQVMYVWFDALVSYISALGWPCHCERLNKLGVIESSDLCLCDKDKCNYKKFWPGVQFAGKDNLRPQAAMWQAMLMAAGLPATKQIFINGFINVNGQKMSKSLGNVISPQEMVEKFGVDGTRYLLLTSGAFGEDWDVSWEKFTEKYNADLANGLGNLVSRVIKLTQNFKFQISNLKTTSNDEISKFMNNLELNNALKHIWDIIDKDNKFIGENKPWDLTKNDKKEFEKVMQKLVSDLYLISELLIPFLPKTAEKIKNALETKKTDILFPRIK